MHASGAAVGSLSDQSDAGCTGLTIRHVLVPLDGSSLAECALSWAVAVAQALAARVTLLRVVETPSVGSSAGSRRSCTGCRGRPGSTSSG